MAKIIISFKKRPSPLTEMTADGKPLVFKKNKKLYQAEIETEKTEVEFTVKRHTHLQTRLWWLWEMLFYVVSLFGLFDMHGEGKNCLQAACRLTLPSAADMTYSLILNSPKRGRKVIRYAEGAPIAEQENLYYINPALEKRKKGLTVFKILLPIFAAIGIVLAIVL